MLCRCHLRKTTTGLSTFCFNHENAFISSNEDSVKKLGEGDDLDSRRRK